MGAQRIIKLNRGAVKKLQNNFASSSERVSCHLQHKQPPAAAEQDPERVFDTAVQAENGGSGACCSSAVKGLQRCREKHAELPERSTFTRPRVYSAVAPGSTHTQDADAGCELGVKKTHVLTCTLNLWACLATDSWHAEAVHVKIIAIMPPANIYTR